MTTSIDLDSPELSHLSIAQKIMTLPEIDAIGVAAFVSCSKKNYEGGEIFQFEDNSRIWLCGTVLEVLPVDFVEKPSED